MPNKAPSLARPSGSVPSSLLSTEEGRACLERGRCYLTPSHDSPLCLAVGRAGRPPLEASHLVDAGDRGRWRESTGWVRSLLVTTCPLITDSGHSHVHLPPCTRPDPHEHSCFAGEAAIHHCLSVSTRFRLSSCLSGRGTIYGAAALHS